MKVNDGTDQEASAVRHVDCHLSYYLCTAGTAGVAGKTGTASMLLSPPSARHWTERCLH